MKKRPACGEKHDSAHVAFRIGLLIKMVPRGGVTQFLEWKSRPQKWSNCLPGMKKAIRLRRETSLSACRVSHWLSYKNGTKRWSNSVPGMEKLDHSAHVALRIGSLIKMVPRDGVTQFLEWNSCPQKWSNCLPGIKKPTCRVSHLFSYKNCIKRWSNSVPGIKKLPPEVE